MDISLTPVGWVRSPLTDRSQAPKMEDKGAPAATIHIEPRYADALMSLQPGQTLTLVTWMHLADRSYLQVHPQGDPANPKRGVFNTRSPDRPNPIALHRVTLKALDDLTLTVEPLEAVDGTPVVDIKPARTIAE
jgi:L-fuculose-phosphate aldolase